MSESYLQGVASSQMRTIFHLDRTSSHDAHVLESKPESLHVPANLLGWVKVDNKKNLDDVKKRDTLLLEEGDPFHLSLSPGKGAIIVNDLFVYLEARNSATKISCDPFDLKSSIESEETIRIIGKGVIEFFVQTTVWGEKPERIGCKYSVLITESWLGSPGVVINGLKEHKVHLWIGTDDGTFSAGQGERNLWICKNKEGAFVEVDGCGSLSELDNTIARAVHFYHQDAGSNEDDSDDSETAPLLKPSQHDLKSTDIDQILDDLRERLRL
jgi:hypothetical protein